MRTNPQATPTREANDMGKPSARNIPKRPLLQDLLGHARKGGQDFISMEEKRAHQQKQDDYERAHRRIGYPRAQEMRQPAQSALPNGLPSLQMLQNLGNALKDGTAFRDNCRSMNAYRPEDTSLPNSLRFNDYFYPRESRLRHDNSSQVSFCKHQDVLIKWHPLDPANKNGSWNLSMKDYFRSPSDHEDHKTCCVPDLQQKGKVLAERIIEKFKRMETSRLTPRDRRNGEVPRRPPPASMVEREIRIMISHMSRRSKTEEVVEKHEAVRIRLCALERKRGANEKAIRRAQQDMQCGNQAGGLTAEFLEDDEEPVVKPMRVTKRTQVRAKASGTQATAPQLREKKREPTAPEDRYHITDKYERDEHNAKLAVEMRTKRATRESYTDGKQKNIAVLKRAKAPGKSQNVRTAAQVDSEKVAQGTLKKQSSKQGTEKQENPRPHKMTAKERSPVPTANVILEDVVVGKEAESAQPPPLNSTTQSQSPSKQNKRKAHVMEEDEETEQAQRKKKSRIESATAVVEDSDTAAHYEPPHPSAQPSPAEVRQAWQVDADAFLQDLVLPDMVEGTRTSRSKTSVSSGGGGGGGGVVVDVSPAQTKRKRSAPATHRDDDQDSNPRSPGQGHSSKRRK